MKKSERALYRSRADSIIAAYRGGKKLREIAAPLGISVARVQQILKHNGCTGGGVKLDRNRAIVADRKSGMKLAHIAVKYNLHPSWVDVIMRQYRNAL